MGGGPTQTGRYANFSDYVRDLIRRDQERAEKIANMQRLIDEGLASGVSDKTMDQLREEFRAGAIRNGATEHVVRAF